MYYLKDNAYISFYGEETIEWTEYETFKDAHDEMMKRIDMICNSDNNLGYSLNNDGSYLGDFGCELHKEDGSYHIFQIKKEKQ